MTANETARDQCEGPFGPFLSDEERAEYEAFLARLASVPEDEEEPGWVNGLCRVCGKPCDEPGQLHYACGDETPF